MNTYAKSRPVYRLDYFLSHAWRTSRAYKYITLCVYFNLEFAAVVTALVQFTPENKKHEKAETSPLRIQLAQENSNLRFACVTINLAAMEQLPWWLVYVIPSPIDLTEGNYSQLCEVVGGPVFVIALFTGHIFRRNIYLFLDIASIPQDDEQKKPEGMGMGKPNELPDSGPDPRHRSPFQNKFSGGGCKIT